MMTGMITIETGVPVPPMIAQSDGLPLGALTLGQSIWIPADDPDVRARWRAIADGLAYQHTLATGRGYVVRSCRRGNGDPGRGVRVWLTSIPAEFIPVALLGDACGDDRS